MTKNKTLVNSILTCIIILGLILFMLGYTGTATKLQTETLGPNEFAFGNTDLGTYTIQNDANTKSASSFTCPTTGVLTSITALGIYRSNTEGYGLAAVYFGSVSSSASLMGQSQQTSINNRPGFHGVTFNFDTPIAVIAGQVYTFAVMSDDILNVYINLGTGDRGYNGNIYTSGFSDPFGNVWGDDTTGAMSIFAICTNANPNPTPTPTPTRQVSLIIGISDIGPTTEPTPGTYYYDAGTQVSITATATSGYIFNYWLMNDGSKIYTPTTTLIMTTSQTALAIFTSTPQPTPTPVPGTTPAPTPAITPEPTSIPTLNLTPTPTPSPVDRMNELSSTAGLATSAITGMGMILYNPSWFGRKHW